MHRACRRVVETHVPCMWMQYVSAVMGRGRPT